MSRRRQSNDGCELEIGLRGPVLATNTEIATGWPRAKGQGRGAVQACGDGEP